MLSFFVATRQKSHLLFCCPFPIFDKYFTQGLCLLLCFKIVVNRLKRVVEGDDENVAPLLRHYYRRSELRL